MTETFEYALVVMASSLFIAGSVTVYGAYSSFEAGASADAAYSEIHWLASRAIENGSAWATVLMPATAVTCQGSRLTVSVGSETRSGTLPAGCDFSFSLAGGAHRLRFTRTEAGLGVTVG